MPSEWYPAATKVLSRAVAHALGRCALDVVKCHYTVGTNSFSRGVDGYFQFLISRDGTVAQFAEVTSLCWDSSEWNDNGPGIEIEFWPASDATIFTKEARGAARDLCTWLHAEWGVPLVHYSWEQGRIDDTNPFRGFIDHAALIQTEEHNDYWPVDDCAYILSDTVVHPPDDRKGGAMWGVYCGHWDGTATFMRGIGQVVDVDVHGKADAVYGMPLAEIQFVKCRLDGFPIALVSAEVCERLRHASDRAVAA